MVCQIKVLSDATRIAFGRGRFDHWCVYVLNPGKRWRAPRDREYFNALKKLAKKHGNERIYSDFVKLYNKTGPSLDPVALNLIDTLARTYDTDAPLIERWFTVLYAGMVAEENKKNAVLKKRIKRLGMHQLLLEGFTAEQAATASRNKKEWMLDLLCVRRGF